MKVTSKKDTGSEKDGWSHRRWNLRTTEHTTAYVCWWPVHFWLNLYRILKDAHTYLAVVQAKEYSEHRSEKLVCFRGWQELWRLEYWQSSTEEYLQFSVQTGTVRQWVICSILFNNRSQFELSKNHKTAEQAGNQVALVLIWMRWGHCLTWLQVPPIGWTWRLIATRATQNFCYCWPYILE